jgi:hypothetical protein
MEKEMITMSDSWVNDERWMIMLREALEDQKKVPRNVIEAAYGAYAWRNIDAELAELTYDSRLEDPALAGVRSQQAPLRALTFASASLTIELEIESNSLLGQLVPPQPGEVLVSLKDGSRHSVAVDELGCFAIEPIPSLPFRLQVVGEASVATDWIAL